MKWELGIIAATVLAVAGVSRRLTGTSVTPAMVFVVIGVLVGPLVIGQLTAAPAGEGVKTLAEATLAVVLFADASRIKPRVLRREYAVPLRLLGVGLPLTIALGAVLAAAIFDQLTATEAIVLAILLAPTDAALGLMVLAFGVYDSGRRHGRGQDRQDERQASRAGLHAPRSSGSYQSASTNQRMPLNGKSRWAT